MPSDQRLHPASILFALAKSAKVFAVPGLLLIVTAGRSRASGDVEGLPPNWELWMMLLLIPAAAAAVVRYLTYRIRYEGTEVVIRSGLIFRNERHIPYARIQNLDAVQNVFHRALGVVDVRVETGGGRETEARISVLPAAAFDDMRRRVFEGRDGIAAAGDAADAAAPASSSLLRLDLRELLLFGFLENRGLVVIGAAYGLAWEMGVMDGLWGELFGDEWYARYIVPTSVVETVVKGGMPPLGAMAAILAGVAGLLVIVRIVSMGWGATRLYGFHLTKAADDLHATYGLLTRVAATIPLRRVQTLTVRQGPLHQLLRRCSVQVETAGGGPAEIGKGEREWLAPLIGERELPQLVRAVLPELDLDGLEWQRPHPRAFRRAVKPRLAVAFAASAAAAAPIGWWSLPLLPLAAGWAIVASRRHVDSLGWSTTEHVVAFRTGWIWKRAIVARVAKIQAVAKHESPFDRRSAMARVRVDTAGAGEWSQRLDIPYLARETARELHARLASQAATTVFSIR